MKVQRELEELRKNTMILRPEAEGQRGLFDSQGELEELRKNTMILRPKGQKGLFNSQGELEDPGPREYLGSGGEKGNKTKCFRLRWYDTFRLQML